MERRRYLRAAGLAAATGLAGCGILRTERRSTRSPPLVEDRPDAVYYPTHVEGMNVVGTADAGPYRVALTYSYPHRFWTVTGDEASITRIEADDSVHLMAQVWDPETGTVLPDTGLDLEVTRDGDLVSQEVIYPMLSQPMGVHYGGNFALAGDGTYDVTVSVGALSGSGVRRAGPFRDRFADPGEATVEFPYSQAARDDIAYRLLERAGQRGAVDRMDMAAAPTGVAPTEATLPGDVRATATTGDAVLVVSLLDSPPAGVAGERYLAVSARTPYNRLVLPAMALSGTLARGDETVFEGSLARTLDPDLGYHYGAAVPSVAAGDSLALTVETPPQVARHEGYETAFLEMGPVEVTL
ncbi:MAG: iron transporter [Halorientalis sp.]